MFPSLEPLGRPRRDSGAWPEVGKEQGPSAIEKQGLLHIFSLFPCTGPTPCQVHTEPFSQHQKVDVLSVPQTVCLSGIAITSLLCLAVLGRVTTLPSLSLLY